MSFVDLPKMKTDVNASEKKTSDPPPSDDPSLDKLAQKLSSLPETDTPNDEAAALFSLIKYLE